MLTTIVCLHPPHQFSSSRLQYFHGGIAWQASQQIPATLPASLPTQRAPKTSYKRPMWTSAQRTSRKWCGCGRQVSCHEHFSAHGFLQQGRYIDRREYKEKPNATHQWYSGGASLLFAYSATAVPTAQTSTPAFPLCTLRWLSSLQPADGNQSGRANKRKTAREPERCSRRFLRACPELYSSI